MILFMWVLACAGSGSPKDTASAPTPSDTGVAAGCTQGWDGWARGFFTTYCLSFHSETSAQRHGAPEGVNFDTLDETLGTLERVRVRVLEAETMPVGGGVPTDALIQLDDWVQCHVGAR